MRFQGLDLNLLVALDTLLDTRHVTRAAERLNISQPAMSSALTRLRDFFDDDILVAHGKRLAPTPYAERMMPLVRETLTGIGALIATSSKFDPETSDRMFRVVASDYLIVAMLAPLIADLAVRAPGIKLDTRLPSDSAMKQLDEGAIDLFITPESYLHPDHPADRVYDEQHVVVGSLGHPVFAGILDEESFYDLGHVAVKMGSSGVLSYADREIAKRGRERRIEVYAASFAVVPWILASTLRVSVMHCRLAEAVGALFPLTTAPLPFEIPPMRQMMQFHRSRADDDGLRWLREEIRRAAVSSNKHPVRSYNSE